MRRTRLVFFVIVALAAAVVLTSRLAITVKPANPDPTPAGTPASPPSLERGSAKLPDLRRLPSEEPLSATVRDVVPVHTSIGSVHFIGEILNTGSRPIAKPETIISLLDAQGNRLLFETGYTVHDVLPPNETIPVVVLFTDPPPEWSAFEVFLQAEEITGREFMAYIDLIATEAEIGRDEFADYVLTGEVQNTGEKRSDFVQVVVSLYGEHKHMVGVGSAYVAQSKMEPGDRSPFTVRVMNVAAPVYSYRLQFVGHAK